MVGYFHKQGAKRKGGVRRVWARPCVGGVQIKLMWGVVKLQSNKANERGGKVSAP